MYMVYIPVYSVYAIYRRDKSVWWTVCMWCIYLYIVYIHIQERQVSVVDSVYMVYIPVYSVYVIYRRDKSVYIHIVYIPYTEGYMSVLSCTWCIYLYIVYMPYTEA